MAEATQDGYWVTQRDKLLRRFNRPLKQIGRLALAERYGADETAVIIDDTRAEFERLIPHIPYIGEDNPMTTYLMQGAFSLALHRALAQRGATFEDTGEIICQAARTMLHRIPGIARRPSGRLYFRKGRVRRQQQAALRSQERRYPGDWVWEIIPGDGETFDLGIDISECGILKFMQAQGGEALMPYMCHTDYITLGAIGIELRRTKTLAYGCDKCDFRMIRNGAPPPDWPPTFPEKDCGAAGQKGQP